MKVFYICDVDLGLENASVFHIIEVVGNLKKLNCDVALFAPKIREYNKKTSVKIKYLRIINKPIAWVVSYGIILFFSLLHHILKEKPDIVYIRQSDSLLAPFLISNLLRVPVVVENDGDLETEARLQGCSLLRIKGLRIIENICYKLSNKIVTVTPSIKKTLSSKYNINPDKIVVIRNGVNTDLFKPLNMREVRYELGLDNDLYYIGYVGNLAVWQGLEYLIKSLPLVLQKDSRIRCLIIGDGDEKERLDILTKKIRLEKNVIFTGNVSYEIVPKYINAFDICVAPFIKARSGETSPLKVYEYLSCSKPTIVSNIRDVGSLFKDQTIVFEPENTEDLAGKILGLVKDSELREYLSKQGRPFILNGHSWGDVAGRTIKVFQGIMKDENRKKF